MPLRTGAFLAATGRGAAFFTAVLAALAAAFFGAGARDAAGAGDAKPGKKAAGIVQSPGEKGWWGLARAAGSMAAFSAGSHYAINILNADQQHLALQFAAKEGDRFAGVTFATGAGGAPVIAGAVATFECFNRSRYNEGDHVIFVGEVERCSYHAGASPLLYHGGRFYTEHPL